MWPQYGREDGQDEVIAYLRGNLALDGLVGLRTQREGVEEEDKVHARCFMGCWSTWFSEVPNDDHHAMVTI